MERGFLNLEFGVLVAIYALWRFWPVLILLASALIADLFAPIAHTFYFEPNDAVRSLHYLSVLPHERLAWYVTALGAYVAAVLTAVCYLTWKLQRRKTAAAGILFVCAAALVCGVAEGQYSCVKGCDESSARTLVVRVPCSGIAYRFVSVMFGQLTVASQPIESPMSHLPPLWSDALWSKRPNLVLITVESWGLMHDSALRGSLAASFSRAEVLRKYVVDEGSVPFVGNTIFGESRDLCGNLFSGGPENATGEELNSCYPARFAAAGYDTVGIHGFTPSMYGRDNWFPRIGFKKILFAPQLTALGMRTCVGGFVGTCDADIAGYVHGQILNTSPEHPKFLHWMTLDSHLPVDPTRLAISGRDCDSAPLLAEDSTVCAWHTLVRRVNETIATIAADPALRPTVFVVTGDHAPPFYRSKRRSLFSQNHVPYVILKPRL